ncbi:Methyltransferase type 11 [Evansella cellulosilytica DSM 2522]|uniref:Methyltransferase type 11 n=2 Tax=Evansella TaxID=2837485 RepID=E6TW13_EVAC2|nr:Methyltransferase type 11 [Evansella cellulosilytica DSM 2522]
MSDRHFAAIYDVLMEDVPYHKWVDYCKKYIPNNSEVLDVACGTGTFTILLYKAGFTVSGIDIAEDMLTIAEEKVRDKQLPIPLFHQDMRSLSGFSQLDAVTLFCDGLNYLMDETDVQITFTRIASALKSGGIFLFDVHSLSKIRNTFNEQLFGENREDISYLWFCNHGSQTDSVDHSFTFFVKNEDGSYERTDEEHSQRTFPIEEYVRWLQFVGFHNIEVSSNFGETSVIEADDRIFFKAEKK